MKSRATPPSELSVVIVDDEPAARRGVRLLLERVPGLVVVGEAGGVAEAVGLIRRERPSIVFLDVQMPDADGFEVLRRIGPEEVPAVVFVTAYDEYALRAFEVHAVDYLLKPYDDARFLAAVERARSAVRARDAEALDARVGRLLDYLDTHGGSAAGETVFSDRILVKSSGEVFFLKPEEIDWIEAEGDYMKFHVGGKVHLMRETMARLEARLDPRRFIRIHRSTIVNADRVRKLSPSFVGEYTVVLADGTKLKLSRGYQERIQAHLKQL